jgi:hypothetical protein
MLKCYSIKHLYIPILYTPLLSFLLHYFPFEKYTSVHILMLIKFALSMDKLYKTVHNRIKI